MQCHFASKGIIPILRLIPKSIKQNFLHEKYFYNKSMINFIFHKRNKEYKSNYGKKETIEKIKKNVSPIIILTFSVQDRICGKINNNKIILYKSKPFVQNSFKPYFYGVVIKIKTGQVVLKGYYAMHLFVRIFMTFWFGCVALSGLFFAVNYIYLSLKNGNFSILGFTRPLFFVALMFSSGYALVLFGQKTSESDVKSIGQFIENTIK